MGNFRMWLANFMRGRYGTDELNKFLLIVAFVLIILDLFLHVRLLDVATVLLLILIYARMFSRSINARYAENQKFLNFAAKFRGGRTPADKTHKILRCPGCGSQLRVPKGAGNIMISCPNCNSKFQKRV
ncbi:MAG: hypothetical protein Q4B18_04470 [Bacillota bacterium]|nr:hypothetical protein [Bacillota bacterium]